MATKEVQAWDKKETEDAIADSRVVTAGPVSYTMTELLADAEASGAYPLPPEEREWVHAPLVGREWPNDGQQKGDTLSKQN